MKPVALAFLAIIALAALACTGGQPTPAPISTSTTAPTVEATVIVATEARATSEAPAPTGKTAVDLPAKTPATEPPDVSTPTLTLTSALVATPTPVPAPTEEPDRPTFAEGEAIAIVQTYGGNCPNAFDPFKQGSWADTYLGNGQWEVVLDSPLWGNFVWRVFEQSRSISLDVSRSGASFIPPC